MSFVFLPPIIIFVLSYFKINRILMSLVASSIIIPVIYIFTHHFESSYLYADKLGSFVLLVSSIVGIGISIALVSLPNRIDMSEKNIQKLYRFFGIFWLGLTISILSNNMGLYWIGLEFATLSTVYMIKLKNTKEANKEAWRYLIVGVIAISLILFGIILMYASSKTLGEKAMNFYFLYLNSSQINGFLFEIGFLIAVTGMFIKMGFFPMNLWLADIERESIYPVGALFSGILESAIILGFFRLTRIEEHINYSHLIGFVYSYALITLFIIVFLMYRTKDWVRLFSFSGIEHMVLISLFWVSGGYFASLLHFAAHAFFKPALFLSSGLLEQTKKYLFKGSLHGYKNKLVPILVSLFLLGIISLPPSPMFFSEIYGFKAMIDVSKDSHYFFLMLFGVFMVLVLLSVVFYKFVNVYQEAVYEDDGNNDKVVYKSEIFMLLWFLSALIVVLFSFDYIKSIV